MEQSETYRADHLARQKAGAKAIEHLVGDDRSPRQKRADREKLAQEVSAMGAKNREAANKAGAKAKAKELAAEADAKAKSADDAKKAAADAAKAAK